MNISNDYRQYLSAVLESRKQFNPRYSLRAFARDIGLAPARLSLILRQKQGLSEESAIKIADRLALSASKKSWLINAVLTSDARSKKQRVVAHKALLDTAELPARIEEEKFRVIADWYHLAILEMTTLADFKSDIGWIASKLGIEKMTAMFAVNRLLQLGFLKKVKGRLTKVDGGISVGDQVPSDAIRTYHAQVLDKAKESIGSYTPAERYLSALTIGLAEEDLPGFFKAIAAFRKGINQELESNQNPRKKRNKLYCLSIQLFPLEKK